MAVHAGNMLSANNFCMLAVNSNAVRTTPPPYTEKCNFTAQEMAPNLPCEDGVREAVPAGDLK